MQLFDYQRVSSLMDQAGVDILVASTRHNVGYLADYWHSVSDDYYVLWHPSVTHKTLVGIPQDERKNAFLIAGASEMTTLEAIDPWIKDRHYWGPGYYIQRWKDPNPDPGNPMDVLADVLHEIGLAEGHIALEMRYLGVSYFERLREKLPKAKFVDAEPILWKLRMIKSADEVRRIREACHRTARVWHKVMGQVSAGMTEKELERQFVCAFAEEEMVNERSYCIFGPAGVHLKNGSPLPSDNPLKPGQFIRIDTQGQYAGYLSNLSRVVAFGDVSPAMEAAHTLVTQMLQDLVPLLKPGVRCSEVRAAELEMYKETQYQPVVPYTGHSVGRVVHEPPYLSSTDQTVLQPGMVVTLEPTVQFTAEGTGPLETAELHSNRIVPRTNADGDIFICVEDQFLITGDGSEWLTDQASLAMRV